MPLGRIEGMETLDTATSIFVKTFAVGPLQCNCTIIGDLTTKQAIVVDPGGDAELLLETLASHELTVRQILHTHAHFDHFLASGTMKAKTGASLALHRDDAFLWDMLEMQCSRFGFHAEAVPPPDQWLDHEEPIAFGTPTLSGQCLHTPGHTPGSMCFHFPSLKLLLGGDTLFRGGIGRTDLWGGDFQQIERSIKDRLYTLDEATQVVAGHGPATSIGDELRNNPYVNGIR